MQRFKEPLSGAGRMYRVRRRFKRLVVDIAYLKEALRTWKGIKSPEAVFVAACKEEAGDRTGQICCNRSL
ncbi:hypothetical protein [Nostoc sp.]|uniref:hypothetical protein n=1 Tax=Nostoc sp. TaxID=1180 RepID=UPI002FFC51BF